MISLRPTKSLGSTILPSAKGEKILLIEIYLALVK